MESIEEDNNRYQVFCCNICWNSKSRSYNVRRDYKVELPSQMSIDIPEAVLVQASKNKNSFNDIVETFCYNLLTKKYGKEVSSCQIWLPLN